MNKTNHPSSFIPYPSYKDSGVAWLGDVPKHWEVRRNKHLLNEVSNRSEDGTEELLTVSHYTGITKRRDRIVDDTDLLTTAKSLVGYKKVEKNNLVMNIMLAWNGSLGISSFSGIVSPAYCVFEINQDALSPKYLHYLHRSPLYTSIFKTASTGVIDSRLRLYPEKYFSLVSCFPPTQEQLTIARFLDYKTAQIARFIKAKKQMIELLKEQKQVIINDAVTGKIVIKDEGGRLKAEKRPDSSFIPHPSSFLQTVPEGWEVKPLKHLVRFNLEALSEKTGADYSFQYLDIGSVKTGYIIKQPENLLFEKSPSRARRIVKQGDTILSTVRTYLRSVFYISSEVKDLIVSTGFAVLTPNNAIAPRYLGYVVQCDQFINRVIQNSIGVSYPAISETKLGTLLVGFPVLLTQQIEILKYIETKTAALDLTISRTEREIALMQEYRTRLISDVVTGKVDVRDIEIPDIAGIDDTIDESIDEPEGEEELETAEGEE